MKLYPKTEEIKGDSTYAKFIKQNLEKIVDMKINMDNPQKGYVYVHEDGRLLEGNKEQFGQNSAADFGGYSSTEKDAINELQYLIENEPFGENAFQKLKKHLQ
ncbi:hypothetical protein FVR03_01445 [Pontibacter qinzhouensis]|uniref:Uncharacterized protein n=1 Tax=Pontibacter qinzhouensis TaxID=2603253 RepID=A0A5C8KBD8_9BACT|nr:hypothetical protein [Pontibacter qinzhouensis]TXK52409.1 hypothetical protein FVR03_01445 [Pontibacter qinzhouensis]